MKMKTEELTGLALDWAVAKCEDAMYPIGNVKLIEGKWLLICVGGDPDHGGSRVYFNPSTDWEQGGPIIDRIKGLTQHTWLEAYRLESQCECHIHNYEGNWIKFGPTPLITAMRCYVASKLGDEVEIPEELISSI
jgi:hypothetical protein